MQANTFDVIPKSKRIILFKLGKLWVFKQFFDNHELFNALLDYYNKDLYSFEFKSVGARNCFRRLNFDPLYKEKRFVFDTLKKESLLSPSMLRGGHIPRFFQGLGRDDLDSVSAITCGG